MSGGILALFFLLVGWPPGHRQLAWKATAMPSSPSTEVGQDPSACTGHIDEASVRLPSGHRIYGVAAVLTTAADHPGITAALTALVDAGRPYLHHYDETPRRRVAIAEAVAELPLDGSIILTEITSDRQQERARAHLMASLLPRLQHGEQVEHVVIESRSTGDKHDRRTRDRLRQSHKITAALRLDWAAKSSTPLVWLPDVVIGSYFSALYHEETQPWKILKSAHIIDVQHLR
jgi:hypothetical protein